MKKLVKVVVILMLVLNMQANDKFDVMQKFKNASDSRYELDDMIDDMALSMSNIALSSKTYIPIAEKYANKFHIDKSLILAIIEKESFFNPLARSALSAFGLMQINSSMMAKNDKLFSPQYLYDPNNNIKTGTKYIKTIQDIYLKGIKDHTKLLYCTIITYNTGIGSLYSSITNKKIKNNFSKIKDKAVSKINAMSIKQLYHHLTTSKQLTLEAKAYLPKVLKSRDKFTKYFKQLNKGKLK